MAPKKAQKMSLGSFLGNTGSWADDMPDLPSAPAPKDDSMMDRNRADRGPLPPREEVPLPTNPPYTAFVGNLAFDATTDHLKGLFSEGEHEIAKVNIINDRDGRPKGFGYVEFQTLLGLKYALTKHGVDFQNRQIRVNVAEPPKEREGGGGFGRGDDEKFNSPWRRDGPPPVRDDFSSGGPRRRYDNVGNGPGGEPRDPTASENNSDWRSNRAPPRVPSESDMPPRRRGSGFQSPHHAAGHDGEQGTPSPADTEDKWTIGGKFKPSPNAESQPGGRFSSMRGKPEGAPQTAASPVLPSPADEGQWRRGKPAESTSPTGSVPPTPQMGRRKLDLLPKSSTGSAQASPLSSPKEKSTKPSPFGAAKPVDVRAKEDAAAAKIEEHKQQHAPMSRTNSRQPRERPPPVRSDSQRSGDARSDSVPRSPGSGAAVAGSIQPRERESTPATVRPTFSFANAAKGPAAEQSSSGDATETTDTETADQATETAV